MPLFTACAKSQAAAVVSPAPVIAASPTPAPSSASSAAAMKLSKGAPLDWWEDDADFSYFPKFFEHANVGRGYENGPALSEEGRAQMLFLRVRYSEYKAYVEMLISEGYMLYDPFEGFVQKQEINRSAIYGAIIFERDDRLLYIEYNLYTAKLRMEIASTQAEY